MKLKHKKFDKVSVYCKGEIYNFVNGEIEVDDTIAKELLKNQDIEEIKEEKKEAIESQENSEEQVEENVEKKKGSKK